MALKINWSDDAVMDNNDALEPVDKLGAYTGNITSITARKLLGLGGKREKSIRVWI